MANLLQNLSAGASKLAAITGHSQAGDTAINVRTDSRSHGFLLKLVTD